MEGEVSFIFFLDFEVEELEILIGAGMVIGAFLNKLDFGKMFFQCEDDVFFIKNLVSPDTFIA